MTTAVYPRNELTWDQDVLDALVETGQAKFFPTVKGPTYVVKTAEGSFAVRPEQVVKGLSNVIDNIPAVEDLEVLRAVIAGPAPIVGEDHPYDYLLARAEAEGISLGEATDGEYYLGEDGHVHSVEEDLLNREVSLLAKFGA